MSENEFKHIEGNIITLDFNECRYFGDIHKAIKESLGFPDYYGENLDALWDCMRYYTDEQIKIIIKGKSKLPDDWQDYMDKIIKIFDDVHKQSPNIVFEYEKD